jgi:AcrR family transcriptional regulator
LIVQTKRREEVAKVRRESIIDAAERVFFRKGYRHATVDEIVKEAEYSKRTVYSYVNSKESMYDAVALRALAKQYEYMSRDVKGIDALSDMKNVLKNAVDFALFCPGYTHILINYHVRAKASPDSILREVYDNDGKVFGILLDILERGVQEGVFRKDKDAKFLGMYLSSTFVGIVDMLTHKKHYMEISTGVTPEQYMQNMLDMTIDALLAK